MNIVRYKDADFEAKLDQMVSASSLFDPVVEQRTRDILSAVRDLGDIAVCEFTRRFDRAELKPSQFPVSSAERMQASVSADESLRKAVESASQNIAAFSEQALRKAWSSTNAHGGKVGEKFDPFGRVGIYVPGGTAPLVSTALMTITLAKVAGCREIVVCTPCGQGGEINPALLFAVNYAGATEIYRVGGAQAIAAMAMGTPTIGKVQKVFGPGNAYVVAAKRLLFGTVSVDLLPGPSELLVLADESAEPAFVAADLLAQAEHGSGHERVWLVSSSGKLLKAVNREIKKQIKKLDRADFIQTALDKNGWLVEVESLDQGVALANRIAPEHCEILTKQPRRVAEKLVTSGALFLGNYSPTVLGDYVAGPSHTLPTGGAGLAFAGLTVDQFQRRTSVVEYNKTALRRSLPVVEKFAEMEGLSAHGNSASIRLAATKRS